MRNLFISNIHVVICVIYTILSGSTVRAENFLIRNHCISDETLRYLRQPCYGDSSTRYHQSNQGVLSKLKIFSDIASARAHILLEKYRRQLRQYQHSGGYEYEQEGQELPQVDMFSSRTERLLEIGRDIQFYFANLQLMVNRERKRNATPSVRNNIRKLQRNLLTMLCYIERHASISTNQNGDNNMVFQNTDRTNIQTVHCNICRNYLTKSVNILTNMKQYFNETFYNY